LALMFTEGYLVAGPVLLRALHAFGRESITVGPDLRWLWPACRVALNLWDYDTFDALSDRYVHLTREAGALSEVPGALNTRVVSHMFGGDLAAAASIVEEARAIASATGSRFPPYGALGLAAFRGHEADVSSLVESVTDGVLQRGEGMSLSVIQYTQAVLNNGLGRYDDALAAAEQVNEHQEDAVIGALPELIEAATRSGKPRYAAEALERLSVTAHAGGTDWGLGIEAACRALLSDGAAAEELYREAIERLGRTRVATALARARLLYGEWLRRERRRQDAREQLRAAHGMFTAMGMEAFAARAARELLATGETARARTVETQQELTPQEDQIARMARDGLSNPEIGAKLFISPRTVEYHLHKVFTKLDITSRNELPAVLERERA
jgi:DNA-binding CsgD family transcriptional regulator